jgi:hypothetical protein
MNSQKAINAKKLNWILFQLKGMVGHLHQATYKVEDIVTTINIEEMTNYIILHHRLLEAIENAKSALSAIERINKGKKEKKND